MTSSRCAVCKHFRRRCRLDCIFAPYFPADNPQRFACVHQIYGASNIGKMLEVLPVQLRADAMESLYYEAKCRRQDKVYGCVGIISLLQQQIHSAQSQLAKIEAEIGFLNANSFVAGPGAMPDDVFQQSTCDTSSALSYEELLPLPKQNDANHGLQVLNYGLNITKLSSLETNTF